MLDAFYTFNAAQLGNEEYKPDPSGLWEKSYKNLRDKLPPLLRDLEGQFQATLGIIDPCPTKACSPTRKKTRAVDA